MRILIYILPFLLLASCSDDSKESSGDDTFIKGADVSFLPGIEADGIEFKDGSGIEKDLLDILKQRGVNTIRLRLWHTPASGLSTLEEVSAFAERIKAKDMKVWLTVHYSDTWADPGHQAKPAAWAAAPFAALQDSVYHYTKKIMTEIDPDIIQLGNEINGGFLFPAGSTRNLSNFISLIKKGVQAVRETSPDAQIMIHLAGFDVAEWVYQQLGTFSVDYDLIGLSYYPMWHGKNLATVQSTLKDLGLAYGKPIVIAETAYPFTLGWEDDVNNVAGLSEHLIPGYPATPEGQKAFLLKIRQMITDSPNGAGFCYWGTEWIADTGQIETNGAIGSSWENQALFDFNNKAVPALDAFKN